MPERFDKLTGWIAAGDRRGGGRMDDHFASTLPLFLDEAVTLNEATQHTA
jgi:hypothetical protein